MNDNLSLPTLRRVRITFGKTGAMQYVGNLDMHTVWERTFRRARLPLAYTKGFNPRPRFQVAASLPVGASSRCELVDVWLENPPGIEDILSTLAAAAPNGLLILAGEEVTLSEPALQTRLISAEFMVTMREPLVAGELVTRVNGLLAANQLTRVWRGKE